MDKFDDLVADTLATIDSFGIKSKTVRKDFKRNCKKLSQFLDFHNLPFSRANGLLWLQEVWVDCDKATGSVYMRNIAKRRAVLLLADCFDGHLDEWKVYPRKTPQMPKTVEFIHLIESHGKKLAKEGKAQATINFTSRVARDFFIYLEERNITTPGDIAAKAIAGYFQQAKFSGRSTAGVQAFAYRLRIFIRFLEDSGVLTNKGLHMAVPLNFVTSSSVVTVVPDAVVDELMASKRLRDGTGIRDRAMILLALRLGLRKSDILSLKLKDIDWDAEKITFIQKKTSVPITLPLLADVGNALANYIVYERPASSDECIFLRVHAPAKRLTCLDPKIVKKHLLAETSIAEGGVHILRRTFATKLLCDGVARTVVSASLGQLDPDSSEVYLANDESRMRECALDLTGIGLRRGGL